MTVIILPSASLTGAGPTLLRLRQVLADQLGSFHATTATAASGGDPSRIVLAEELRDDEVGYDLAAGMWLYVRTGAQAGSQRRIVAQPGVGYQGPLGALVLSRPLAAPLVTGDVVEVTSPLPVRRSAGRKGLNDCITEALERLWVEAQISLTGNGTDHHDLSVYRYVELGAPQILGTSDSRWAGSTMAARRSPGAAEIVTNGVTRTLVTDAVYGASETFTLDVVVRADRLVYDGTSWYYPATPGLQGDAWQTAAPERWVVTLAMVKALQELTKQAMADRGTTREEKALVLADLADKRATWASAAKDILLYDVPKALPQRGTPFMAVGAWA